MKWLFICPAVFWLLSLFYAYVAIRNQGSSRSQCFQAALLAAIVGVVFLFIALNSA